jgi:cytochrome c553
MKEAAHLIRVAVILIAGVGVFAVARQSIVPTGFGQYGHFRAAALSDNRSKPQVYAGRATCALCHEEVANVLKASRHAAIGCEACHGPQFRHSDDPSAQKPVLPDTLTLCARCHEKNLARPKFVPQVDVREHSGGEPCKACHQPHSPKVGG